MELSVMPNSTLYSQPFWIKPSKENYDTVRPGNSIVQ
jgi:hypothetical protein